MVVGTVTFNDRVLALSEAQQRLAREVNPAVYPPAEFRRKVAEHHHFIRSVLDGPKVFVLGNQLDLERLAEEPLAGPS